MQQQKAKATAAQKKNQKVPVKAKRAPRKTQSRTTHARKPKTTNGPTFISCALTGPDGQERSGWELWVGGVMFGRADSKESLKDYYTRLQEPMPSGHWRNRPIHRTRGAVARQAQEAQDAHDASDASALPDLAEEQESAPAEMWE